MDFENPEDREYFANLFCSGDSSMLESQYQQYFDFRDPQVKRTEFNKIKSDIKNQLTERYGNQCMLAYPELCTGGNSLVLDHFIPLSSNILNKTLRHLPPQKGKKVPTQSFGSNHPDNFALACPRCNAFKKHRMPDAALVRRVMGLKNQIERG